MAIGIVRVTDKNFRITIPEEIRKVEDIKQGDYVQVDIVKMHLKNSECNEISNLDRELKQIVELKIEMMKMNKKIQTLSEELETNREYTNKMEK